MTDKPITVPPKSIRAIFLLTCFKILLAAGFFVVAMSVEVLPLPPQVIGYTAAAYLVLAIPMFVLIHRHNALGVRIFIVLAILASLPARAVIGIGIDVIALILTFRSSSKRFFGSRASSQAGTATRSTQTSSV